MTGAAARRPTMHRWARDSYGGPEVLRAETVPVPEPGPGEVLVRVVASSVNTADLEHLEGHPWLSRLGTGLRRPRHRVPGFDVVVDIAATRGFLAFRRALAPRGRYTLIARDVRGFAATGLLGPVLGGRRRMGVFGWEPSRRRDLDALGALLASGALRTITDRRFPLAEAPEALAHVRERRAVGGKIVLLGDGAGSW